MTPDEGSDTTTVCGSSGEDEVQAAQRGQVKAQIIKRPAANILLGFPSEGKAEQTSFASNTESFSAVYVVSVGYRSRLARSRGVSGGRSRIEFIMSPPLLAVT